MFEGTIFIILGYIALTFKFSALDLGLALKEVLDELYPYLDFKVEVCQKPVSIMNSRLVPCIDVLYSLKK